MTRLYANERFATVDDLVSWGCDCLELDGVDDLELIESALDAASDQLAQLSGMRFRGRGVVVDYRPKLNCASSRSCIRLLAPVVSVQAVKENGVTLATSDWSLVDGALYRTDAQFRQLTWGRQNPLAPLTASDTVGVSYTWGHPVTDVEKFACIELACDLLGSWVEGRRDPMSGAQSASGGGLSFTMDDDDDEDDKPRRLPLVSRFLARWNPRGDRMETGVFAPSGDLCLGGACSC